MGENNIFCLKIEKQGFSYDILIHLHSSYGFTLRFY